MNAKRAWLQIFYAATAAGGGIIGGLLSDYARHLTWPMAAAAQSENGQIVSAGEFDLVDQSGKVRAKLFLDGPYSPKLALYEFNNQEGASIAATVLGGEMILSSRHAPEQEELQAKLSAFYDHAELTLGHKDMFPDIHLDTGRLGFGASLNLSSGPDHNRAIQAEAGQNSVFVLLRDHNAEQRAGLELDVQDNPGIFLFDQKGGTRSSLVLDSVGDPSLSLFDTKKPRVVLGGVDLKNIKTGSVEHRSPSSLVLFREDGKTLWSAP